MAERLGVLLLGGIRHQDVYAEYLRGHPAVRLVGLADEPGLPGRLRERGRRLAAELELPFVEDVAAALDDPAVDAVCVGSEPARHARLATAALEAGKHALVDKPIATTAADARALAAAAERSGRVATYVHRLGSPQIVRARAAIDAGRIGLPRALSLHWTVAGELDPEDEETPVILDPSLSGGGELANFLGYPVDYARWLTGLDVRSVYATTTDGGSEAHRRHGVERLGVLTLELERGVVATIVAGRTAGADPAGGLQRVVVTGSHGVIAVEEERPQVAVVASGGVAPARPVDGATHAALTHVFDEFVRAARGAAPPSRSLAHGARLVEVVTAAYESARSGRVVAV
jgi:myo-inositol 2-dehydrogenase / D-chiro-inositol 1-dehydrogenase